jgi:predicted sulfurtransferase
VAHKPLPPIPEGLDPQDVTLVLFYQYVEPIWSKRKHKDAVRSVMEMCTAHGISGRGRCAPEGLNCTLTGSPQGVRDFCRALRAWDPVFNNTDFKLTDGFPYKNRFKSLSIRKTTELVAYGLGGQKAPELKSWAGEHLRADEYHAMLAEENAEKPTVVIDVRNAYESVIGHFNPPEGGAELLDPKMRNSKDFAPWLALPETQAKLNGKRVMMYCTGGIRCERATALLNQMTAVTPGFDTQGVYELRGGVDRYMKTFPDGGFWKGKNYVFDRRQAQVPAKKAPEALEADVESKCVVCRCSEDVYRGKHKCGRCAVPVIVCASCRHQEELPPLQCELCLERYEAPTVLPDFSVFGQGLKKKRARGPLDAAAEGGGDAGGQSTKKAKRATEGGAAAAAAAPTKRLFVGKLPLLVTVAHIKAALGPAAVDTVQWLTDRKSGHFYGSAFISMESSAAASALVDRTEAIKVGTKKIKLKLAPLREGEVWPPANFEPRERPPIM